MKQAKIITLILIFLILTVTAAGTYAVTGYFNREEFIGKDPGFIDTNKKNVPAMEILHEKKNIQSPPGEEQPGKKNQGSKIQSNKKNRENSLKSTENKKSALDLLKKEEAANKEKEEQKKIEKELDSIPTL